NWRCDDVRLFIDRVNFEQLGPARAGVLNAVPTRFVLPAEQVELLIESGADALRQSRSYQAFRRGLGHSQQAFSFDRAGFMRGPTRSLNRAGDFRFCEGFRMPAA
ncbi:MAG TPA: hypothetical protein VLX09_06065, partial [Stellaceae bacterium]|nr:hypothetical protein [Stellaceae bacterium]